MTTDRSSGDGSVNGLDASAELVRGHPAVRTLMLPRGELAACLVDERTDDSQWLNSAAAAVWALLDRPMTERELTDELAAILALEVDMARELVAGALETFRSADLLEGDGEAAESPSPTVDEVDGSAEVVWPQRLSRPPDH